MNSALWDINRWGWDGIDKFKENLVDLMRFYTKYLPPRTQVVWMTTPPIAVDIRCGFVIKQLEFQQVKKIGRKCEFFACHIFFFISLVFSRTPCVSTSWRGTATPPPSPPPTATTSSVELAGKDIVTPFEL